MLGNLGAGDWEKPANKVPPARSLGREVRVLILIASICLESDSGPASWAPHALRPGASTDGVLLFWLLSLIATHFRSGRARSATCLTRACCCSTGRRDPRRRPVRCSARRDNSQGFGKKGAASKEVQRFMVLGIATVPKRWQKEPKKVGCFAAHLFGLVLLRFGAVWIPKAVDFSTSLLFRSP